MAETLVPEPARVVRVVDEALGVKTYYLRVSREKYAGYRPGQFVMLYICGVGEIPVSISDLEFSGGEAYIGLTIKSVGVVTEYIHRSVNVGSVVGVRGPYGNSWMIGGGVEEVLIVAGGIGLAPLRPLIKELISKGDVRLVIMYGARTPEHIIYRKDLTAWSRLDNVDVYLTVDRGTSDWRGFTGFVTDLIDRVDMDGKTIAYVCGPEVMMKKAVAKLLERGVRGDNIFLSMERRMRCGIGVCGSCQYGHYLICRDGPVFKYSDLADYIWIDGI